MITLKVAHWISMNDVPQDVLDTISSMFSTIEETPHDEREGETYKTAKISTAHAFGHIINDLSEKYDVMVSNGVLWVDDKNRRFRTR